jgi:hypothetical protein
MASRLLNDPVSVRGALRGTQRRRWLPHRFANGVLRRCRAGSYSRSSLRAIAGSGRLGALRLSHRVQHLPWPQSFCQDAAGECQRRSSAAADLPLLSAICLFCSRLCVWAAPVSPPACSRTAGCRTPAPQIEYGGQCHISNRPYTVFRWRPGSDARYKKTIICQEVAKAKNVCQVRCWHRLTPHSHQQGQPSVGRRAAIVPIRLPLHYPPITLLHAWCRCACWIWSMACRCRFGTRR